ncbi:MAG: hypothetical protein MZU84_08880 [Sphingobacterium sp.]|nr:hypothetical protein [Sphingobacterium sp.]
MAIHGLETYVDGESPRHWQHITSHEIGHEYWGEWVLEADDPAWTWIALGIFADTEYMTVRGYDPDRAAEWIGNYVDAVPMYYDTTLDALPGREDAVHFDFNNTVVHSKGPAVVFALEDVLGRETFLRLYKRCLRDFGGRPFGWRDLRTAAEAESGQNLAWFFDAWVRSNRYLSYAVERDDSRADGQGGFKTALRIKRLGTDGHARPGRGLVRGRVHRRRSGPTGRSPLRRSSSRAGLRCGPWSSIPQAVGLDRSSRAGSLAGGGRGAGLGLGTGLCPGRLRRR